MHDTQHTPAMATEAWLNRCDRLQAEGYIPTTARVDEILGVPRPKWAHPDCDIIKDAPQHSLFSAEPACVPLSRHLGHRLPDTAINMAQLVVEPRQGKGVPFVWLERHSAEKSRELMPVPGSGTALTIDEAVELAHTLLDAVAVLTEPAPDPDTPIGLMPVDLDEEA